MTKINLYIDAPNIQCTIKVFNLYHDVTFGPHHPALNVSNTVLIKISCEVSIHNCNYIFPNCSGLLMLLNINIKEI